jgi:hypothetical protein
MLAIRRSARVVVILFVALVLLWITLFSFESGGGRPLHAVNISSSQTTTTTLAVTTTTKNQNDQGKCENNQGQPSCKPSGK